MHRSAGLLAGAALLAQLMVTAVCALDCASSCEPAPRSAIAADCCCEADCSTLIAPDIQSAALLKAEVACGSLEIAPVPGTLPAPPAPHAHLAAALAATDPPHPPYFLLYQTYRL